MLILALLFAGASVQARSQGPRLEELDMEFLLDQATRAFHKQDLSIEQLSADFKYRCLRAVGDHGLCQCLVDKRPYSLRFEQYVGIISRTRAELAYDTLSQAGRAIVDRVYQLREECVSGP